MASSCCRRRRLTLAAQVGLNAHRVLDRGEWRRCASSLLVHRDLPHLVSNATSLVLEGLPLEARLGSARLAGLALSCAALAQGLYRELCVGLHTACSAALRWLLALRNGCKLAGSAVLT